MKYLSKILAYFNSKNFKDFDEVSVTIAEIFENNSGQPLPEFYQEIKEIKSDFFKINKINRKKFAEELFSQLSSIKSVGNQPVANFIKRLEIGTNPQYKHERELILEEIRTLKKPHAKAIELIDDLFQKIAQTSQIRLHGVKEYSGVDLLKLVGNAKVGIQIKTKDDDISEDKVRAIVSKAIGRRLSGFILIYFRPSSKKVDESIAAVWHFFDEYGKTKIVLSLISPQQVAELIRFHKIKIN